MRTATRSIEKRAGRVVSRGRSGVDSAVALLVMGVGLTRCSFGYDSLPLDAISTLGGLAGNGAPSGAGAMPSSSSSNMSATGGTTGGFASTAGGGVTPLLGGMASSTGGASSGGASSGGTSSGGTSSGGASSGGTSSGGTSSGGTSTGGTSTGGAGGLVGYWKLDEATTAGVVADSSGFGNNGTYSASKPTVVTTVPAAIQFPDPNCLRFNGSTNYVTIPNSPNYTGNAAKSFTFSAWAFMSALPNNWKAVVAKEDTTKYCGLWLNPFNEWTFEPNVTSGATAAATTGWHHLAAVQDGGLNIRKIYVDGVLSANTDTAVDCSSPASFHIGSGDGTDDFWNGRIDDVRIYNTALSAQEIQNLAQGN
ncbi:MAG: LamG domain-containing protein [Polyangiaceae bacterium]|nr:LamG domain-containing protein [Polyangiaceae bacterium]